jgi:hypothetical protein
MLKKRIKELEDALLPKPLFVEPISTLRPIDISEDAPESSSKLKGASSLLTTIRKYVADNINKRVTLILDD